MVTRKMRDLFYTLRYATVLTVLTREKYRKRETSRSLIAAVKAEADFGEQVNQLQDSGTRKVDNTTGFLNSVPLDIDLTIGQRYIQNKSTCF